MRENVAHTVDDAGAGLLRQRDRAAFGERAPHAIEMEHLAHREQAERDDDDVESIVQGEKVEREALHTGDWIVADEGHQETENARQQALSQRTGMELAHQHNSENGQQQEFRRPQNRDELKHQRNDANQRSKADPAAESGGRRGNAQRASSLALSCHGVAVDRGRRRFRRTRRVEQNRGDRAGEVDRSVRRDHQREALHDVHAVEERQQHGQQHCAAQSWDHADECARKHTGEQQRNDAGIEERL
jgi:hypothetical protein